MQINEFIKQLQEELANLPQDDLNKHDLFVYYESQITLAKFYIFCEKYKNVEENISAEFLNNFENILSERWANITRTRASYNFYSRARVKTSANLFCMKITNSYMVAANTISYRKRTEKELLMPVLPKCDSAQSAYSIMVASVIQDLKNPEINAAINHSNPINMKLIAERLLVILEKFYKNKDSKTSDLFVELESQQTLNELTQLLQKEVAQNNAITRQHLQHYVKYLKERWRAIDGTPASYCANPGAKVNAFCNSMANYLSLMAYRIDYLNREPKRLLMPPSKENCDEKTAYNRLQQFVYRHLTDCKSLLSQMSKLAPTQWKEYLSGFSVEHLTHLLTDGKTLDSLFQAKELNLFNHADSGAFLFCLFEIYIKSRLKKPHHTSLAGALFQYVTTVYNMVDKVAAAEAVQEFIISQADLSQFYHLLNDPQSKLFKHRGALKNNELQKFTSQIGKIIGAYNEEVEISQPLIIHH